MEDKNEGRPPVLDALLQCRRAAGRKEAKEADRDGRIGKFSKPLEITGRKAMGAKVLGTHLTILCQPGRRILCIRT